MSSPSPRPHPTLRLPAALLRFWPAGGDDARARQTARAYAAQTGVAELDERFYAVWPSAGREHVFEDALTLGQAILAHLRKIGASSEVLGILIFPGEIELSPSGDVEPLANDLLEDLESRAPAFKTQGIYLTGYAASWLGGRFQFDSVGLYDGPSGRRIPLHRLLGEAPERGPWHNPEFLGRQVKIPRPAVRASLDVAADGVLRVLGTLGTGKSWAVWHYLLEQEGPKLWFRVGRSLFGTAALARRLVGELYRLAPESLPLEGGDELRRPEALAPVRVAELLSAWLDNACQKLGSTLWIVCDIMQSAVAGDLDLLANLLARRGNVFRLILISRSGGPVVSQLVDLPQITIPPMDEEEFTSFSRELFAGLSMDSAVEKKHLAAAAGHPFALEEGLTDLVHRGLVRRVYGSFFYNGGGDVEYEPSRRLVRHVAAEAQRLGEPLPLRILAAVGQPVPAEHLEDACATYGISLPPAWHNTYSNAGWLTEAPSAWGPGLAFKCPAYERALAETVAPGSIDDLRQALGKSVVAQSSPEEVSWQTYQLIAGTEDALPSLLQLSKKADTAEARREMFTALEKEYRLHRSREGDPATELDLLWKWLPLGHRLGKLGQLEAELERALELAVGEATRFAALALIKAEHDQDQGRHHRAVKGLEAALMASEGSEDQRRALLVIRLGILLERQEQWETAETVFKNLLEVVDRGGATTLGATCHFHLGEIALARRDLELAAEHHRMALELRRAQGQVRPLSASLSAQGTLAMAGGDYPSALELYRQAKEVLGDDAADEELATAELGRGRALSHLGEETSATRHLRHSLELVEDRGGILREQEVRLALALNQLALGHVERALKEARQAHFQLSLLPASTLLARAERTVGQVLVHQKVYAEAGERFSEAQRLHLDRGLEDEAAYDASWLLAIALEESDKAQVMNRSAELESMTSSLSHPVYGEVVFYRLFQAFEWLRERRTATRDPEDYLRRAYQELMRQLGFLEPKMRHPFLFNVREHQKLINTAMERDFSLPSFSTAALARDSTA